MQRAIAALVAIAACCSLAYAQPTAPADIWRTTGTRSYEASYPGLGSSRHFSSIYGWIDVFVYGLRRDDWIEGTADPQFDSAFQSALAEIHQAARLGITTDLTVGTASDAIIQGQAFRVVRLTFTLRGQKNDSALYLGARRGQLVKYRITVKSGSEPDLSALAEAFIASDLLRPAQSP